MTECTIGEIIIKAQAHHENRRPSAAFRNSKLAAVHVPELRLNASCPD
jgi:hypothetical protein